MTYDETEARRIDILRDLQLKEIELYENRRLFLPMKDDKKFSSELARKVEMDARTAGVQAQVDAYVRELEVLADRARWLAKD